MSCTASVPCVTQLPRLQARVRPWLLLGLAGLMWGCGAREFPGGADAGQDTGGSDTFSSTDTVVPRDTPVTPVDATITPDVGSVDAVVTMDVGGPDVVPPGRVPLQHRATATACDQDRPPVNASPDSPGGAPVDCGSDVDCTDGVNGRCVGNGHDGYYCNYDECFDDSGCGTGVCQCGGGFRSDNNICLGQGNCRTDADCGAAGYCSPSFGSCGDYSGVVAYFCHTPQDECLDDEDCPNPDPGSFLAPYCAFIEKTGRWQCSNSQCAG